MSVIVVTGCVGVGKSTLSKKLGKALDFKYVDIHKVLRNYKLKEEFDRDKRCWIVDVKKLNKALKEIISKEKNLVIDGHLSHYLPKSSVSLCIVVRCSLKELKRRLKERKYSVSKVKDNLECEVFDVCTTEALSNKHNILVVSGERDLDDRVLEWIKKA
tara:strand:- start:5619 stop:6095 length:477 start_codon:yes stop_codon:yes gene_type:complete